MAPTNTTDIPKKFICLEAASDYVPVHDDNNDNKTEHKSYKKSVPTSETLLTVQIGDKFYLPDNEFIQWILVKRMLTDELQDHQNEKKQPWGFIPTKCLSSKSRDTVQRNFPVAVSIQHRVCIMAENGSASPRRVSFMKKLTKTFSFDSKEDFFRRFNDHFYNMSKHKPFSTLMKFNSSSNLSITLPSSPDTPSKLGGRKRSLSTSSVELGHFPYSGLMPAPSPRTSTSNLDALRKQAKQDNNLMVLKLARTEQQLHEALEKNKTLNQRTKDEHGRITLSMHQLVEQLVEKGEQLDEAHHQIEVLTNKLEREIQCSSELYQKVKDLEKRLEKNESGFHSNDVSIMTDTNDNELKFDSSKLNESLELIEQLKRSTTPIGDLMLSCTLCNERIGIEEIESHSSICSSGPTDKSKSRLSEPRTPRSPGMLVATVTSCERDCISPDVDTPFKIICKTTIPDYKKTFFTSEKNKEDFIWFRNALEEFHPERVIPPLSFYDDLSHNMRELQRFLSRICGHKIFKNDTLVRKFLSANAKEMEKLKKSFKKQVQAPLKHKKPAIEVVDEEGLLHKTQQYITQFMENLSVLIHFFKTNDGKETINGISECFVNLGKGEENETYVQAVFQGLGGIIAELENRTNVLYDQSALAEDLESLLCFVKAADELLYRVECSVNTYLYWEEEIRVFEEMKSDGLVTSTNGKDITHLWAEASSNCRTAKDELEKMCRDLSDELSEFDIRKEKELKQILIEYADSRCDVFEKMQGKWFGVKLMLDADIVPNIRAINFSSHK